MASATNTHQKTPQEIYQEMVDIINSGRAVQLANGVVVTKLSDLPTLESMARHNKPAQLALLDSIDEQIASLSAQRARLVEQMEADEAEAKRAEGAKGQKANS